MKFKWGHLYLLKGQWWLLAMLVPFILFQNCGEFSTAPNSAVFSSEGEALSKSECVEQSLAQGFQLIDVNQLEQGMDLPAGDFVIARGALINKNHITISGVSRDDTRLRACIGNKEAGIRVLAKEVSIRDLNIEVYLTERLRPSNGTGDMGTAITLGRFLNTSPSFPEVTRTRLSRLKITRRYGNTATALALIGNVSFARISDLIFQGKFANTILMHWGGQVDPNYAPECKGITSPEVYMTQAEADKLNEQESLEPAWSKAHMKCPVLKTWHVNNIIVDNVRFNAKYSGRPTYAGQLLTLSSTFNIQATNFHGIVKTPLFVLPGDEGHRYAVAEHKDMIGRNHLIDNWNVLTHRDPKDTTPATAAVILQGAGTSKFRPFERTTTPYHNLKVSNFTLKALPNGTYDRFKAERGRDYGEILTKFYPKGLYVHLLRGKNILVENMDLGPLGRASNYNTKGVHLKFSHSIQLKNIKNRAQVGVLLQNSRNIYLSDSRFFIDPRAQQDPLTSSGYGVQVIDMPGAEEGQGYLNSLTVNNSKFVGHRYGVYMQNTGLNRSRFIPLCERIKFRKLTRFRPRQDDFATSDCPVNLPRLSNDLVVFAGQSNMVGSSEQKNNSPFLGDEITPQRVNTWINYSDETSPFADNLTQFDPVDLFSFEPYHIGHNSIQMPSTYNYLRANPNNFGPEASFANLFSLEQTPQNLLMLKVAKGATSLVHSSHWNPEFAGINLYDQLIENIRAARKVAKAGGQLRCFVWVQGEYERRLWTKKDSASQRQALEDKYKRLFRKLVSGVRQISRTPDAKVVIVELSPANQTSSLNRSEYDALLGSRNSTENQRLRQATRALQAMQSELAEDPHVSLVRTTGLSKRADNIHYDVNGTLELGERIYDACY